MAPSGFRRFGHLCFINHKLPEAASYNNSTKLLILLPLRAIYFYSFHYETPCKWIFNPEFKCQLRLFFLEKQLKIENSGFVKACDEYVLDQIGKNVAMLSED